jgi:hypothetical protein
MNRSRIQNKWTNIVSYKDRHGNVVLEEGDQLEGQESDGLNVSYSRNRINPSFSSMKVCFHHTQLSLRPNHSSGG